MTEPATQQDQPDISTLSYEQAREELVMTVKRLETGNLPLEESLRLWERGEALADRCQDRKSTRLNSSHVSISYAVFCLKKKKKNCTQRTIRSCMIWG